MSENNNINEKVINIFKNAQSVKGEQNIEKEEPPIKFFAGVNYVRIDEDFNGHPFNKELLIESAAKFAYIVRVLKLKNGKHSLYNYNVPYDKIVEFISLFDKNELSGTIIEIDKYKPNELA
ncbi:hypothetical protein IJE86_09380 [bacterium]|nr:hypothetical protein [bacterium]